VPLEIILQNAVEDSPLAIIDRIVPRQVLPETRLEKNSFEGLPGSVDRPAHTAQ